MCFFAGGTRFSEQGFGISTCSERPCLVPFNSGYTWLVAGAVQLNSSLLTLSVIGVLLPAAFHNAVQPSDGGVDPLTNQQEGHDILSISHGVCRSL
jgi:Ca2+:H+ antiporter